MNDVYFCSELWECISTRTDLTVTINGASVIFACFRDDCEKGGFNFDFALPSCGNVSFSLYFRGITEFEDKEFTLESGEFYCAPSVDICMAECEGGGVCVGIFSNKGAGCLSFYCSEVMEESTPRFKEFYEKNKNYNYLKG